MKSFCVLNAPLNKGLYEKIGAAAFSVFGGSIGVAVSDESKSAAAAYGLCGGIVCAGGTAELFGSVNESRIPFLMLNYSLSAFFYVDGNSPVSVYSGGARQLTAQQEELMAQLIARDDISQEKPGVQLSINSDYAYKKALVSAAENLEGVCAGAFCADTGLHSIFCCVMNLLGADISSKPRFFISRSGFGISARDETGKIFNRENLLDICYACRLKKGESLVVPFSASACLEDIAKAHGACVKRGFDAGENLWQADGLFLVFEVLRNMAVFGCGLSTLAGFVSRSFTVRKNFSCDMSAAALADMLPCNEMITDDAGNIYLRHDKGGVLLTRCRNLKSYCMEVSASDSESASELAADIGAVLST